MKFSPAPLIRGFFGWKTLSVIARRRSRRGNLGGGERPHPDCFALGLNSARSDNRQSEAEASRQSRDGLAMTPFRASLFTLTYRNEQDEPF